MSVVGACRYSLIGLWPTTFTWFHVGKEVVCRLVSCAVVPPHNVIIACSNRRLCLTAFKAADYGALNQFNCIVLYCAMAWDEDKDNTDCS